MYSLYPFFTLTYSWVICSPYLSAANLMTLETERSSAFSYVTMYADECVTCVYAGNTKLTPYYMGTMIYSQQTALNYFTLT